ncbi:histone deacetylase family protein [Amaricoccus macauensis]|uniref:histone deacetylase family protein n=1 Tax=Amaricoccus macauensis TaxID=57001 RepID=UPI003C7D5C8B
MIPLVYHPHYIAPLKPGHRFPMSKYGYLREELVSRGLLPPTGGFIAPAPASVRQVAAVHDLGYVERVAGHRILPDEVRRIGLPNTAAVARRAFLSAAGTLLAARLAFEHGIACNMAGGSHHAGPAGGAGFCVFNDVAVAAQSLLDEGLVRRVLIIDCDVHQGDGTADIFRDNPRVFTLSLHAEKNYPARKARSDLDFPLPDGLKDAAYLELLDHALDRLDGFAPDIVFYNAGVDPHEEDRLGRLALTSEGLRAREARVIAFARQRGVPFTGVLGGGYDENPERLAARHAILFEEAARYG